MRRAFKYRLYPNGEQRGKLQALLDAGRALYNAALEQRRDAWKARALSLNYYDQAAQLKEARDADPFLGILNYSACQAILRRLQRSFDGFFRRIKGGQAPGYPRFKGRDRFDSVTFPAYGDGVKISGKRLRVQNVGEVKIKLHRPVEGKIKTATLKREGTRWYAVFSCDEVPTRPYPVPIVPEVGLDMGLESFVTLSTGEKIENPRHYREAQERLAAAQRALSRKKRGSNRRRKARARVARLHVRVANQRRDFQHKLARRIVSEHSFMAVEALAPKSMAERSPTGLAKSIHDAGWAMFLMILCGKAEEAGRTVVKVNPRGTSSTCIRCGTYREKALSEREHVCGSCGLVLDRDVHASLEILRRGRRLQASA